jgi:hypothetical protein
MIRLGILEPAVFGTETGRPVKSFKQARQAELRAREVPHDLDIVYRAARGIEPNGRAP